MPTVLGPVLVVTAFSAVVAAVSLYWGKEVGLSNNVGECHARFRQKRNDV